MGIYGMNSGVVCDPEGTPIVSVADVVMEGLRTFFENLLRAFALIVIGIAVPIYSYKLSEYTGIDSLFPLIGTAFVVYNFFGKGTKTWEAVTMAISYYAGFSIGGLLLISHGATTHTQAGVTLAAVLLVGALTTSAHGILWWLRRIDTENADLDEEYPGWNPGRS